MKKRVRIPNKLLIVLLIIAVIVSIIAAYFSVYANSAQSYANPEYKSVYSGPPRNAFVGVSISDNRSVNQNAPP